MSGISRAGIDTAGGTIQPTQILATINGVPIATLGAAVKEHGEDEHAAASMVQGSAIFTINGVPVVLAGMLASCGHSATGDPKHNCFA